MASNAMKTETPSSNVEKRGLPPPPVAGMFLRATSQSMPESGRPVPPPAISAAVHFKNGGKFVANAAVVIVPAITAAGAAMVSRTLSIQEM